jgi:hypothetical protein
MKKNEWQFYIRFDEMPDNGTFICQPTDDVLDEDCWPVWAIIMVDGVVIHQENLYAAPHGGYSITDMKGWTKVQVVEWVQYDPYNNPQQVSHNILWLSA